MNNEMWEQGIVQENCVKLKSFGWTQIGPDIGSLACGNTGIGRLSDISKIFEMITHYSYRQIKLDATEVN